MTERAVRLTLKIDLSDNGVKVGFHDIDPAATLVHFGGNGRVSATPPVCRDSNHAGIPARSDARPVAVRSASSALAKLSEGVAGGRAR